MVKFKSLEKKVIVDQSLSRKLLWPSFISMFTLTAVLEAQCNIFASADPTTAQQRWATIEDDNKDRLKVETTNDKVWTELVQLYQNGSSRWIGGIVEACVNECGFRFNPDIILIAEITIEAWQTTIRGISQNLNYWLGNMAVVAAGVIEIHVYQPVGGIVVSVDKFALFAPLIGLTYIVTAISVESALHAKGKRRKEPEGRSP